jgi:hypothetical protein
MTNYLVELYRPSPDPESLRGVADRLAVSARSLSGEGTPVRYIDAVFLPDDEISLHLFEASCDVDVRAVVRRAGLIADRIVPATKIRPVGGPLAQASVPAKDGS